VRKVDAVIYKNGVKVSKDKLTQRLLKWIEKSMDDYVFIPALPTLYLVEKNNLDVYDENNLLLTFEDLFRLYSNYDKFLLSKYLVFRDLAVKGFYIKDISRNENLLFEIKKNMNESPRLVIILEEGYTILIDKIMDIISQEGYASDYGIVACVERRGGVTYYEVSRFGVDT